MFERLPTGANIAFIEWDSGHCNDLVECWLKSNGVEYVRIQSGWFVMFKIISGEHAGYYDVFADAGNRRVRLLQDLG